MQPGPVVRPTLVLDVLVNAAENAAGLIVAYGTDNSIKNSPHLDADQTFLLKLSLPHRH